MSLLFFSSGGKIDDAVGSGAPKTGKVSTLLIIKLVVPLIIQPSHIPHILRFWGPMSTQVSIWCRITTHTMHSVMSKFLDLFSISMAPILAEAWIPNINSRTALISCFQHWLKCLADCLDLDTLQFTKGQDKEFQIVYRFFLEIATYCMYLGFLPGQLAKWEVE